MGFRDALRAEAQKLGLAGWVRNRGDGTVEALAQGEARAIDRLIAWAHRGPPLAAVQTVEEVMPDPALERAYAGFERWPTA